MSHHRLPALILAAAAVLAAAAPAALAEEPPPEGTPRVAIVVLVRVNVTAEEGALIADRMADALRESLFVDPIGGTEVDRRLADSQVPEDCVARPECVADLATRLDADEMLFLVIVRVGDAFQIDSTWVDPKTGRIAAREAILLEASDKLPEKVFRQNATMLLPHARERTKVVVVGGGGDGKNGNGPTVPPRRGKHMTTPAWIAAGVGAAALIGGATFGVLAVSESSSLQSDNCDMFFMPDCAGRADTMQTHMTTADLLFGTAAVAGGVALYFYLTSADKEPRQPPPITPVAPPGGGAAIMFTGSF